MSTNPVASADAAKAALQEAMETAGQSAREAQYGDHQAQRALARAAALRPATK